jgi:hypothetical protein
MKNLTKHAYILLAFVAIMIGACKNDPDPVKPEEDTPQQKVTKLLTAQTWKVQGVTVDGLDASELFPNLTITFTSTGFTTTNGGPVWPASGTWSFASGDTDGKKIARADGKEVTIITIDENTLKCTLHWDETVFEGGRNRALEGEHSFTFTK